MLAKKARIKRSSLISFILRKGDKISSGFFVLRYRVKDLTSYGNVRFATLVSKKIYKKACDRNKLRRQMSEVVRVHLKGYKDFSNAYDIVILPTHNIVNAEFDIFSSDLKCLLKKILI